MIIDQLKTSYNLTRLVITAAERSRDWTRPTSQTTTTQNLSCDYGLSDLWHTTMDIRHQGLYDKRPGETVF